MDDNLLSDIFQDKDFGGDDLFAILESLEDFPTPTNNTADFPTLRSHNNSSTSDPESSSLPSPQPKRQKLLVPPPPSPSAAEDGQHRMSHITVERNRRKQMNEHLSVLRSLMPCFYVKRGDQASIIGGVVDYINELQQVLQALEAKKQRKVYTDHVLSPRLVSSPRTSLPLSPRKPPLSPRLSLPISPRTPQPGSPYRPPAVPCRLQPPAAAFSAASISNSVEPSPTTSSASSIVDDINNELVANSKSAMAEVEVKFSGPHLLLKTVSQRIPGQALKIISALEDLALEILQVNISTADETMLNSFTIK
ncbi:hypothetical protein PIB30_077545, partial [Stylosanthes scabra]|nr:hypothetical protein [Stylosanthes scabra]